MQDTTRYTEYPNRQLYLVGIPGQSIVKIGVSCAPHARLTMLRNGDKTLMPVGINRSALELLHHEPGGRALEVYLHRRLYRRRVIGEWFDLGPVCVALVRSMIRDSRHAEPHRDAKRAAHTA